MRSTGGIGRRERTAAAAGINLRFEAADVGRVGHLQADEELVAETVAMELRHHGEIAAPGVGVAKCGNGALEVGAGLGRRGLGCVRTWFVPSY
jgi:hypothetical protein